MKTLLFLTTALAFASCAPKAFPVGSPDPRDQPGHTEPTAASIRRDHMRELTENPGYQLWEEMHED